MDLNSPEYREQLRRYLEAVGPVQGQGMAATWAWKVQKERKFRELVAHAETKASHKPVG